tara:strand:- start:493 stop:843 length:351 start_codon:yes stop_codon:yes gene_type:complete
MSEIIQYVVMAFAFMAYFAVGYGFKVAVEKIPVIRNINIVGNIIAGIVLIYIYQYLKIHSEQAIMNYLAVLFLIMLNFSLIFFIDKYIARNKAIVFNHIWLASILLLTPSIILRLL